MSATTPTVIAGRYELQRRLAQGGMAEVWLAIDLTLDRKVAVKWLKPTLATDEIVAERFRREAIAAASLNHPNIVAVHDVFEQDGRQAVVMQLVDGKSLRQLLDNQKRLSPELTCHIGQAVAVALDHAHEAGFVHRDVKPGNIMITPDGRVLLTDFGIAKGLHGEHGEDLTSDNIMMGTAKYLSPEQVRGKRLDGRADLYSLGLVLYECLAGRVPFLGETDADTALARLQRDPTDLARLRATLPAGLVRTIHDLLARNPDQRPATGADLAGALKKAASEGPPEIDETDPPRSPVAPFSAGRLVRAPSDLRGRSQDRDRGGRTPTPPRGKTGRSAPSRPTPRPDDRRSRWGRATRSSDAADAPSSRRSPSHPSVTPPRRDGGSGPVAIPGEPPGITGAVPVQDVRPATTTSRQQPVTRAGESGPPAAPPGRSATADAPRADTPRDATPPAGTTLRGRPAKGMGHRWSPSLTVVGVVVAVALVVGVVLWATLIYGGGEATTTTTVLPAESSAPVTEDEPVADGAGTPGPGDDPSPDDASEPAATPEIDDTPDAGTDGDGTSAAATASDPAVLSAADARIVDIVTFDPDGNGEENDQLAVEALADGEDTTVWRTECYSNEWMGSKPGVGLVVSFNGLVEQSVSVAVASEPFTVDFYASADQEPPSSFEDWGPALRRDFASSATTLVSPRPDEPVRHVLVSLVQLGPADSCSDRNPFRGVLDEITLLP